MSLLQSPLCSICLCSVLCTCWCLALPYGKILYTFPFTSALFFHLAWSNPSSPNIVSTGQCFLLFPICKEDPANHCPPLLPSVSSNTAFHSTAFLSCMAPAFGLSLSFNANSLGMGTTSEAVHLSPNSTNPLLFHAIHKCFSIYCLVALFPSLPWGLLSSTCLLQTMWAWRGREGTAPQSWHTNSMLMCMVSLGQERPVVLVGGTFLLHWPAALHNLSGCPQLVQLAKHPVVQNVAIRNDEGDLEWWCIYLLFKYLSCHDQDPSLNQRSL